MSPQRLFNDYMPPYKAGLDAGSGAVMVALNSLNGTPATSDSWLLKDVLRDQWGFKGITVSDHGAIKELIKHGTASDPEDAVRVALKSGINMSMSDEYYSKYLPGLVKSGKVTMAELDDAARHVLNVKYDMGLFNDPYSHLGPKDSDPADTNAESRLHRKEAREVARESLGAAEKPSRHAAAEKIRHHCRGRSAGRQQARRHGQLVRRRRGGSVRYGADRH